MKLRKWIDSVLFSFLAFLMAAMVLNVIWQVASRYLFRSPSNFTDEMSRFLLIWVGLLGASYVAGKKLHLAIDILPEKLEGKKQKNLNILINVLVSLFAFFVMVWGGIKLVYMTLQLEQTSAALNIPLGYVYLVVPLSGLFIIYYSIVNLYEQPKAREEQGKQGQVGI